MRQIVQDNAQYDMPAVACNISHCMLQTGSHQDACLEPEPDVDDMLLLPLHINEARNPWGQRQGAHQLKTSHY